MTEKEIHLKLSEVVIDNDNIDYIKATGEICGKLRWDLVKLFAIPDVSGSLLDDESATEPIQDALYATGRFTTDECDTLAEGILRYIKDAEIMMVGKQ